MVRKQIKFEALCKMFEITRTIQWNSKRSEQFLKQNEGFSVLILTLEQLRSRLKKKHLLNVKNLQEKLKVS